MNQWIESLLLYAELKSFFVANNCINIKINRMKMTCCVLRKTLNVAALASLAKVVKSGEPTNLIVGAMMTGTGNDDSDIASLSNGVLDN